jgi:beta-glucosidase
VFLAGPSANNKSSLHGCWSYSWQGNDESKYPDITPTLKEYLENYIGKENVISNAVRDYDSNSNYSLAGAEKCDIIILAIGENAYAETPGSIRDLVLDKEQQQLVIEAHKLNKPIVVVLVEGRPRVLNNIEPMMDAVLMAYWPGEKGAEAIVKTLYGENNPSGKLPFTYPRYTNHFMLYDAKYSEQGLSDTQDGFTYKGYDPQWGFGEGLSYSTFEYSNLKIDKPKFSTNEEITISITVKNTGNVVGEEVVELYSRDHFASVTPSYRRLRKYSKIELAPGESKNVTFKITSDDLKFVSREFKWITEFGGFDFIIQDLIVSSEYIE